MRTLKKKKDKEKIKIAMKELHIVDTVNSGRTAKEISEQAGFSLSKTRRLLNEMGPEGVVDYIREYNYWIFQ